MCKLKKGCNEPRLGGQRDEVATTTDLESIIVREITKRIIEIR